MSSINVITDQIPNTYVPGFYGQENVNNALQGLSPLASTVCLIAQETSSGSVPANTPTKVFDSGSAQLYFGSGSIAHKAVEACLEANPNVNLTVLPLADAIGSAKASGSFGVTGICTTAGSVSMWIGDQLIQVNVSKGDTAVTVCNNAKVVINQIQSELAVTAGVTGTNHVELTARNGGTLGNQIDLSLKASPSLAGFTFGITGMNAGSGDPTLGAYGTPGTPLAAVVGGSYNVYITTLPDSTNLTSLNNMLTYVSGPVEQRPAVGVVAYTDLVGTYANVETLADTLNSGRLTVGYVSYASDNLAKSPAYEVGASYGALIASTNDPSIPYDGLVLTDISVPSVIDRFTFTQKDDLLHNGVAPLYVAPGEQLAICRAVTTYQLNSLGVPDATLLDINTYRTLDYVREQVRERITSVFVRAKLNQRTINLMRAEVLDVLYVLEQAQIVQNVKQYESGVIVQQDLSDVTRLDIAIPTNIVSGLHVVGATFNLILGV